MANEDDEGAIRARINRAMTTVPAPDRARLARIERGLPPRSKHRRRPAAAWWWAIALGGVAAATAGAYWAVERDGQAERTQQERTPTSDSVNGRGSDARDGGTTEPGSDAEDRDGPVIYQR